MKRDYLAVLMEEIRDQNKLIMENLGTLLGLPVKVDRLEVKMDRVEKDIKVIKGVIKDTNKQVWDHERRITQLETTS